MSEPHQVEIPTGCEIHDGGSGRLVLRREGDRVVLDGQSDHCCVFTLDRAALTRIFDVLAEWL